MSEKQGLQRFTDLENKFEKLLALKEIEPTDLDGLTKEEEREFLELVSHIFHKLTGDERDRFYQKIEPITSDNTKNQIWEYNHSVIMDAITRLMQAYGRMPTKAQIAIETDLSRTTVHKHLRDYSKHPLYFAELNQFRFMASGLMTKLFQFAMNGDVGAAKLYFNVLGMLGNGQAQRGATIKNQTNYIQINGTVLSQESLQQLSPEQLNNIEAILKAALPQSIDNRQII